jgi:uncharacterized lipoprotein YddW (UPF0748 family)
VISHESSKVAARKSTASRSRRAATILVAWLAAASSSCAVPKHAGEPEPEIGPHAQREFRAAWVASVANINWPSEPGLPVAEQKREAIELLDLLERHHYNAVVFQVRPQADALYESELEPWSYYLTGEQGKAPHPYYDPLEFWIEAAHDRGLELHAWLNPYRAHHREGGPITERSIVRTRPDLVVELKDGFWWMDPGQEDTKNHSLAVVMDIVRRYDVDGIHFDDYFYPYPSTNHDEDFPDDASWNRYKSGGGKLSRDDWRRANINDFIESVYKGIKREKPHVKFGLSPFGIWRPHHPESIEGFDQYGQMYADARLWLNEGWVDYWSPQLYWPINQIPQSYPVLLGWWTGENEKGRHLWPGLSVGRIPDEPGVDEVINQIMITRGMVRTDPGNIHWSIGSLVGNEKLLPGIMDGPYQRPALVPSSPWLDDEAPRPPRASAHIDDQEVIVAWEHDDPSDVFRWVVYYRLDDSWSYEICARTERSVAVPLFAPVEPDSLNLAPQPDVPGRVRPRVSAIAVSAVDRTGNESAQTPVMLDR